MKFPSDIRAEILTNILSDESYDFPKEYYVQYVGGFKRNYQNDIDSLFFEKTRTKSDRIRLSLNRHGIYDKLPEALFHRIDHTQNKKKPKKKADSDSHYDVELKQKQNARKIFQPIENELFRLGVNIDRILQHHHFTVNTSFFKYLYGNEEFVKANQTYHPSLFAYSALFCNIRGNMEKIRLFLAAALQTKVESRTNHSVSYYTNNNPDITNNLENMELGINSVCGSKFADYSISWVFTIYAGYELLNKLIEDPRYISLLEYVSSSLLPAGVKEQFHITCTQLQKMHISRNEDNQSNQYLGYNIIL